jgi:oligosaccharide repeat unit polymerase
VDPNLFVAVTAGAVKIYAAGFEETGEFTGIPFLVFLPFAATALAGIYAAWKGRIDGVVFLPLLVAAITGILSVSRYSMVLSATLFLGSFVLTPKTKPIYWSGIQKLLITVACIGGIVFVSIVRIDLGSSLHDQRSTLTKLSEWIPAAPSLYFYLSGPPVGLSEYLNDSSREANLPWGRYTFASVYRFLAKFGLASPVSFHQEFYSTPEAINVCTYLREIHSDFGPVGVFLCPFLLGVIGGWSSKSRTTLFRIVVLTHVYLIVLFSFTYLAVVAGQWPQRLAVSLIVSVLLERASIPTAGRRIATIA